MTSKLSRLLRPVLAAVLYLAALSTVSIDALAAPPDGLDAFTNQSPATKLPRLAKANSGVTGKLNAGVLSAPVLNLTLADGTKIQARLERIARDDKAGVQSWIGTFDDAMGSSLVISKAKGVVTGFANYLNKTIVIRPATGGMHVLYEVDTARLPQTDTVYEDIDATADDAFAATVDYGTGGSTQATTSGSAVVHDVLILYTAATASRWGAGTIESMIQSAVQSANQAYLNSKANVTLHVVGLQKTSVTEGSGMGSALTSLKNNSTVKSLRNNLGADMVIMITENTGSCGSSSLSIMTLNGVTTVDAYAVSNSDCLSEYTLAHELGHLQRLDHNREDKVNIGMYAYSYGYRRCVTGGFRDIMSYPCSNTPRILNFSNPSVNYSGYPTGISYESDPSHSAENARTLNNTATTVAGYSKGSSGGGGTTTVPAAPSSLTIQAAYYNKIKIGWVDNSTNEAGFQVQRSRDGVTFSDIATLGAGMRTFTDTTVASLTRYYYRVRSYNSAGSSGFSNTVNVTTPAPRPAAPTNVAAVNKANGSALVTWTDASTNETGFDVCRKKYSTSTSAWSSCVKVGSVPTGTTKLLNACGKGTFRFYVRAVNAGGMSTYSGPAQVTVTGGG